MSNVVREKLEAYFASLNSTSSRMMADIISSREEYRDKWDNMLPDEQSEILWKSIVKNDAASKYKDIPAKVLDVEYFPVLRTRPGAKIIVEDDSASAKSFVSGSAWHDEHSAPFRWETQSQLELRIHDDEDDDIKVEEKTKTLQREAPKFQEPEKQEIKKEEEVKRPTVKRPEVPPPPVPPHATPPGTMRSEPSPPVPPHVEKSEKGEIPIYAKVVKRKSSTKTLMISELKAYRKAREEMKPAVPPRMSLELKGDMDLSKYQVQEIDIDGIPKTGFDFLDNW